MKSPGGEKQRAKQEHININHTSDLVTHLKRKILTHCYCYSVVN